MFEKAIEKLNTIPKQDHNVTVPCWSLQRDLLKQAMRLLNIPRGPKDYSEKSGLRTTPVYGEYAICFKYHHKNPATKEDLAKFPQNKKDYRDILFTSPYDEAAVNKIIEIVENDEECERELVEKEIILNEGAKEELEWLKNNE